MSKKIISIQGYSLSSSPPLPSVPVTFSSSLRWLDSHLGEEKLVLIGAALDGCKKRFSKNKIGDDGREKKIMWHLLDFGSVRFLVDVDLWYVL